MSVSCEQKKTRSKARISPNHSLQSFSKSCQVSFIHGYSWYGGKSLIFQHPKKKHGSGTECQGSTKAGGVVQPDIATHGTWAMPIGPHVSGKHMEKPGKP